MCIFLRTDITGEVSPAANSVIFRVNLLHFPYRKKVYSVPSENKIKKKTKQKKQQYHLQHPHTVQASQ